MTLLFGAQRGKHNTVECNINLSSVASIGNPNKKMKPIRFTNVFIHKLYLLSILGNPIVGGH